MRAEKLKKLLVEVNNFYYYIKEKNTAYITAVFNAKRDYMRVMKKFI